MNLEEKEIKTAVRSATQFFYKEENKKRRTISILMNKIHNNNSVGGGSDGSDAEAVLGGRKRKRKEERKKKSCVQIGLSRSCPLVFFFVHDASVDAAGTAPRLHNTHDVYCTLHPQPATHHPQPPTRKAHTYTRVSEREKKTIRNSTGGKGQGKAQLRRWTWSS